METRHYWEENGHAVKYDNFNNNEGFGRGAEPLSFAPPSEDEEYPAAYLKKGKVSRQDPMSHRIIEKRRRDRMNNCLADLSRLIPPEYLKKGRGRVEKTEIIEMAIRHLKFLQDRVNALERRGTEFRAGYQQAVAEAVRFLADVQGFGRDGLSVQLASHLQRHCDVVAKEALHDKRLYATSSSETASSSSSSQGYAVKVIQRPEPPPAFPEPYEPERKEQLAECDRVAVSHTPHKETLQEAESLALDGRVKREPTLRKVRKPDHADDYLHSYKFKNSIERRFSRSQDSEGDAWRAGPVKSFAHKRRRCAKPAPPSTTTSGSGSTEDAREHSPQVSTHARTLTHTHAIYSYHLFVKMSFHTGHFERLPPPALVRQAAAARAIRARVRAERTRQVLRAAERGVRLRVAAAGRRRFGAGGGRGARAASCHHTRQLSALHRLSQAGARPALAPALAAAATSNDGDLRRRTHWLQILTFERYKLIAIQSFLRDDTF